MLAWATIVVEGEGEQRGVGSTRRRNGVHAEGFEVVPRTADRPPQMQDRVNSPGSGAIAPGGFGQSATDKKRPSAVTPTAQV